MSLNQQLVALPVAVTGLVLAGGRAQRMGGGDKGLLSLAGKPLIAHVLERLQPQVDEILISANRNVDRYRQFGWPVIEDAQPEQFKGPLAGVLAAMQVVRTPYLLTVPCDSPLLPVDYARRLGAALACASTDVAVARWAGAWQPVFFLAPVSLRDDLARFLAAGEGGVSRWLLRQRPVAVEFPQGPAWFANLNAPEDLARMEAAWDRVSHLPSERV